MDSYVYKNLNSYECIVQKLRRLLDCEVVSEQDGCLLLSECVDIDVNKKYTSIRVKKMEYDVRELRRIILER